MQKQTTNQTIAILPIQRRYRIIALSIAIIAGACYASFPLAYWLNAPFAFHGEVSVLGEPGQPYAALFNSLDVLSGFLLTALCLFLLVAQKNIAARSWRWALLALLVSGVGAISAAVLPLPAFFAVPNNVHALLHASSAVFEHGFASFINTSAFMLSTALWMRIVQRQKLSKFKRFPLALSMLLIVVVGPVMAFIFPDSGDIIQRVFIVLFAIWLVFFTYDALYKTTPELV